MLDDLKYIHQRDAQDAFGIAEKQYEQLRHDYQLEAMEGEFDNIVYAGMGGSSLAALLSGSWPDYKVPFEVCRQYHIPAYVSDKTLFIAASYSGNTEETLSALGEAEDKGARIVVITGGGNLQARAEEKSYPMLIIPKVQQPRFAVLYNLKAIVKILEAAGLVTAEDTESQMQKAADFLKQSVQAWLPTVPASNNPAKQLAQELAGKSPAIYAGPILAPVAYKWKINFNENAKNVAWCNELPEFDHNELTGWTSHPVDKPYGIVELRSKLEHPRIQKRFEVGERLLSGRRPAPEVIEVQGSNTLEQLVWAVTYGDFVTLYVAMLNGLNPTPVDLVEKFKKALDE